MAKPQPRRYHHKRYHPTPGTKRYYYIQAMREGGTAQEIADRAISIARRDGQHYTREDMRNMSIPWLTEFARLRGYAVLLDQDRIKIFG